jgi:MazG family protein
MIRRHPHVFGDEEARAAGAAKGFWDKIKAEEKRERAERRPEGQSVLDGVSAGQPGLARAVKLQDKAGSFGFDWNDPGAVLDKLREETVEIEAEIGQAAPSPDRIEDEIGDLLFTIANLARHLKVDPDQALRRTNAKFMRRFSAIERGLAASGRKLGEATLDEMEALWQQAKKDG